MKSLIIDTSMSHLQIGLFDGLEPLIVNSQEQRHRLGDLFHPILEEALLAVNLKAQDLNRIIVTQGPGSFTGVRVGLSAGRSLSTALNIPVYGLSSLKAMSLKHDACVCAIDTRRHDYFVQSFDAQAEEITPIELKKKEELAPETIIDEAIDLNLVNAFFFKQESLETQERPKPIYVRSADAAVPKNLPQLDW